jgi:site-specific recombinase XerD
MIDQKLLDKFQDYLIVKDCSKGTIKIYTIAVKQFMDHIEIQPEDITQQDLDKYKVYLRKKYEQNSLIPKIHGINNFLKFIGKKCYIKAPSYLMKNTDCLTQKEIFQLFKVTEDDPRDNAILKTLYFTGIRRGELVNLNMEDIDSDKQKLKINEGKGKSYNIINIHPKALQSIEKYIKSHRGNPSDENENALFLNKNGKRLSYMTIMNTVKRAGAKAGITKRIYPHLLRASLITHMDENGASMMEIKAQSRHKDTKTLEIYIRHSDEHLKNVYMKTVPSFDKIDNTEQSSQQKTPIPLQNQIPVHDKGDKYIDLLEKGLIKREDFLQLMGINNQYIEGYS